MKVLYDDDVSRFPKGRAVDVMRQAVLAAERGDLEAPARVHAAQLTFTAGSSEHVFGFRAYSTRETAFDEQLVAVWNAQGRLEGVIVGEKLGPLRTAAIGALATQTLARSESARLGLIGSSTQAEAHALAVASVRRLEQVLVYSPNTANRERLTDELRAQGLSAEAGGSAHEVCTRSDLLTLATNSSTPVIETSWVRPGTHVCTLGPKEQRRHEFPTDLANRAALIVTDSPTQLQSYKGGYLFADMPVVSLGACLTSPPECAEDAITLFLSVSPERRCCSRTRCCGAAEVVFRQRCRHFSRRVASRSAVNPASSGSSLFRL